MGNSKTRKRTKILIVLLIAELLLFAFISLTGIIRVPFIPVLIGDPDYRSPVPIRIEGLTFSAQHEVYPHGTEKVTILLDNQSEDEFRYGVYFSIEKRNEKRLVWEDFPWDNVSFPAILHVLPAHTAGELTVHIGHTEKAMKSGTYRLWFTDQQNYSYPVEIRIE